MLKKKVFKNKFNQWKRTNNQLNYYLKINCQATMNFTLENSFLRYRKCTIYIGTIPLACIFQNFGLNILYVTATDKTSHKHEQSYHLCKSVASGNWNNIL